MILSQIQQFFILIRWFHSLFALFPFIGIYITVSKYDKASNICDFSNWGFISICLGVELIMITGFILNDIIDKDIDAINKPNSRIVERTISLSNAWKLFYLFSGILFAFSIYIELFIFPSWFIICSCIYLLSIAYNVYLKRAPLIGNITMSIISAAVPLTIALYLEQCISALHIQKLYVLIATYTILPFMIIIPRELSLDISDIEGDRRDNCRTLPILIGVKRSKLIVQIFLLFTILLSSIAIFYYSFLAIAFVPMNLFIIYYIVKLKSVNKRIEYIRIGKYLWLSMIVALILVTLLCYF